MTGRTLIVRLDNLGDVLLAGPAVRAVAASERTVTLLCGPNGRAAADLLVGVHAVCEFRAPWIDPDGHPVDAPAIDALVGRIAEMAFDDAFVLTSFHQSALPMALVLRLAGVPTIAAISTDFPGTLLDVRHGVPDDLHEVERNLSLVGALDHRLPLEDDGSLRIERRREPVRRPFASPYVVVHPGATMSARAWSWDRHRDAVAALVAAGWCVAVTGGGSEQRLTAAVADAARHRGRVADLGGRTTFAELAAVLAGAAALVVGNTGAAHLAAAVGTPVVSLYAPTVPFGRWRPWQVPTELLGDQAIACAGCRARACPADGHPCLAGVGAADVVEAVERLTVGSMAPMGDVVRRAG